MNLLDAGRTAVVMVDVQERLVPAMAEQDALVDGLSRLLRGAALLGLPVIATEHVPAKLGPTLGKLAPLVPDPGETVTKSAFSCCAEPAFIRRLETVGRRSLLLCGIEAHVCVYQTAMGLLEAGYDVEVVGDAVSARTVRNRDLGLRRIEGAGGRVTGIEMALLEMTRSAEGDLFRRILQVVK